MISSLILTKFDMPGIHFLIVLGFYRLLKILNFVKLLFSKHQCLLLYSPVEMPEYISDCGDMMQSSRFQNAFEKCAVYL